MAAYGYNVVNAGFSAPAITKTFIQIKAGAAVPLEILRIKIGQRDSITSANAAFSIVRKSAAGTVTPFTPLPLDPNDAAAAAAGSTTGTGINASAEGTDSAVLDNVAFNILNGYIWTPSWLERIFVPAGAIIGIKTTIAWPTATYDAVITFREFT